MATRTSRVALPLFASVVSVMVSSNMSSIANESKRRGFYQDDENVARSNQPVSPGDVNSLGPKEIIEGVTVRSPPVLEQSIKDLRLKAYEFYTSLLNKSDELAKSYYTTERKVTSTISSLHERREDLLPNSIYILVSALTGSIVSRRSNILVRGITPVIFGLGAFRYFLPLTFERTKSFVWSLEKKNLPEVAQFQQEYYGKAESLANDIEKTYEQTRKLANDSILSTEKSIAEFTGLNLGDNVDKDTKK